MDCSAVWLRRVARSTGQTVFIRDRSSRSSY
jgi:hypothetical protein